MCLRDCLRSQKTQAGKAAAGLVVGSAAVAAAAVPMSVAGAAGMVTNPWVMALDRADKAGAILAQALLSRQQGHRPVILLGFSCGARLIFSCLEALAKAPGGTGRGIVDSTFLLGAPVDISAERWAAARSVVAFRLVNGFSWGE